MMIDVVLKIILAVGAFACVSALLALAYMSVLCTIDEHKLHKAYKNKQHGAQ